MVALFEDVDDIVFGESFLLVFGQQVIEEVLVLFFEFGYSFHLKSKIFNGTSESDDVSYTGLQNESKSHVTLFYVVATTKCKPMYFSILLRHKMDCLR